MDEGCCFSTRPFSSAITKWRAVGGAIDDSNGTVVTKPSELEEAETILGLCERFGCLPSQLKTEDASLFRLLRLEEMGGSRDEQRYRDHDYQ